MPDSPTLCPFCNAEIDAVRDPAKPACPRCDAPLPPEIAARLTGRAWAPEALSPPGRKKTALGVLGIMAAMAAIAVGYALWTQQFRRDNDFKKGFVPTQAASQAPDELAVVGYLPPSCNIIGAINLTDARANPVMKAALFDDPPRSVAWLRDQLLDATGLSLDDIEHVALGAQMTDQPPKILVVLQTKNPYNMAAVLKPFGGAKPQELRARPLVRFTLPHIGQGAMWCMTDRHVAFLFHIEGRAAEEFQALPTEPRKKLDGSPEMVKKIVAERVDKQAIAWFAADLSQASGLVDFLSIVGARIEPYRPLLESKALVVNVKTDRYLVMLADVLAGSEKAMPAIEASLKNLDWRNAKSFKIESTPPEAKAPPWVTMQLRYEPDAIRELLSKGPGKKAD